MEEASVIRQEGKTGNRKPHHRAENTLETIILPPSEPELKKKKKKKKQST